MWVLLMTIYQKKLLETSFQLTLKKIFIELSLHKKFIIGAFYPSPRDDINVYLQHTQSIELLKNEYESHEFILMGDYNIPKTV